MTEILDRRYVAKAEIIDGGSTAMFSVFAEVDVVQDGERKTIRSSPHVVFREFDVLRPKFEGDLRRSLKEPVNLKDAKHVVRETRYDGP